MGSYMSKNKPKSIRERSIWRVMQAVRCCTLLLPSAESRYFPSQSRSSLPTSGTPAEKQEAASALIVSAININAPAVNIFPTSLAGQTLISGQKL